MDDELPDVRQLAYTYYYAFPLARGIGALEERQLLLEGSLRLSRLAQQRLRLLPERDEEVTLGHLRDWCWGVALQACTRSLLYSDSEWTQPTAHARRFFSGAQVHRLWPAAAPLQPGFYGVAGSLAFVLYRAGRGGEVAGVEALLEQILQQFWQQEGLNWEVPPPQRLLRLWQRYQLRPQPWAAMERLLTDLYWGELSLPQSRLLNQLGLEPEHWRGLERRVWFLQVDRDLEDLWAALQEAVNGEPALRQRYGLDVRPARWWSEVLSGLEGLAVPAGFALVAWAYAVEGFYRAGQVCGRAPEVPWLYFVEQPALRPLRQQLLQPLLLVQDALALLDEFHCVADGGRLPLQVAVERLLPPLLVEEDVAGGLFDGLA